jgi:hypothetical protein
VTQPATSMSDSKWLASIAFLHRKAIAARAGVAAVSSADRTDRPGPARRPTFDRGSCRIWGGIEPIELGIDERGSLGSLHDGN